MPTVFNLATELQRAVTLVENKNTDAASKICKVLLKDHPNDFDVVHLSGVVVALQEKHQTATSLFQKAITLRDDVPSAYINLARSLHNSGSTDAAVAALADGLKKIPRDKELLKAHIRLAKESNSPQDALQSLQNLLLLDPEDMQTRVELNWLELSLGQAKNIKKDLRRVLDLDPRHVDAFYKLTFVDGFVASDPLLSQMQALASSGDLATENQIKLHFALGKAFDSADHTSEAAKHFESGNYLKRNTYSYAHEETDNFVNAIRVGFEKFVLTKPKDEKSFVTPIFIVGLPRSGTTLVEQSLAKHSQVYTAGETLALKRVCSDACAEFNLSFPQDMSELSEDIRGKLADAYIAAIRDTADHKPFLTDKLPANFLNIGLIRWLFPEAKIVHCVRDLRDSCLSIYQSYFPAWVPYAYDQTELGRYAKSYIGLMDYWRQALPGFVYDLEYELMVTDFEPSVRALLDFCSLPFEISCLDFQSAENRVQTLSVAQVRQPVSGKSVGKWRRYEGSIQSLLTTLDL